MLCFAALLLVGLICLSTPGLGEDAPTFQIVQPTGEAHSLLTKTCRVCHKEEPLRFFVVAATTDEELEGAFQLLSASEDMGQSAPPKPKNPHAAIVCLFCHMEQPVEGAGAAEMGFRTLEGEAVPISEVQRLCQMCHPEEQGAHPRVVGHGDATADLARTGLPVHEGRVLCSTCHEMRREEADRADARLAYATFASKSPRSFPHGNRMACAACYPGTPAKGGEPAFLEPDPGTRCTRCRAEDHSRIHPVDVAASEKTYPMDFPGHPLDEQGRATCSTCDDHVCYDEADPKSPRFLRGGPYLTFTEFCYQCHPEAGGGSLNPHVQVSDAGEIITTTCVFCHRVIPEDPEGSDFSRKDLLFCTCTPRWS